MSAGCALGEVTRRSSTAVERGRVINARQRPGSRHKLGTPVGLTLSLGPRGVGRHSIESAGHLTASL